MTERVVSISAPNIVANKVNYTDQVVNTATPEIVTNVTVSGVTTDVTTDTLNFVFTGIGEDSLPNPTLFKRGQEYVSALDAPSISTGKTFLDSLSALDSFNVLIEYNRIFEETQTASEVVDKFIDKTNLDLADISDQNSKAVYRAALDSVVSLDAKTIIVSKATIDLVQKVDQARIRISKPFAETKYVADTFSRTINYKRSFTDTVDATDDFLGEANVDDDQIARIGKNTVDYTTTSDSKLFNVSVTKLDAAQAQDQKVVNIAKPFLDGLAIPDQKYLEVDKVFLETNTLSDVVNTSSLKAILDISSIFEENTKAVSKVLLDTGLISEVTAKQVLVQHLDNTTAQDQVVTQWNIVRNFQETQQITSQLPSFNVSITKLDTVNAPDQISKTQTKIFLDNSSLLDSFSTTVEFKRSFVDSINVTDDFLGQANVDDDQVARVGKVVVDTVTIPQTLSFDSTKILQDQSVLQNPVSLATTKPLFSVFATSDSSTHSVLKGLETQTNYLAETFNIAINKPLISNFTSLDQPTLTTTKVFSDLVFSTDSFSTTVDFKRTFLDSIAATDDFLGEANIDDDQIIRVDKKINDLSISSDTVLNNIATIYLDNFASTDTTYKTPGKVAEEVIATSDVFTFLKFINQLYYEVITSSDSGFINNQSYFAGTYVEPGYVGTNTYFT